MSSLHIPDERRVDENVNKLICVAVVSLQNRAEPAPVSGACASGKNEKIDLISGLPKSFISSFGSCSFLDSTLQVALKKS